MTAMLTFSFIAPSKYFFHLKMLPLLSNRYCIRSLRKKRITPKVLSIRTSFLVLYRKFHISLLLIETEPGKLFKFWHVFVKYT